MSGTIRSINSHALFKHTLGLIAILPWRYNVYNKLHLSLNFYRPWLEISTLPKKKNASNWALHFRKLPLLTPKNVTCECDKHIYLTGTLVKDLRVAVAPSRESSLGGLELDVKRCRARRTHFACKKAHCHFHVGLEKTPLKNPGDPRNTELENLIV